MNRSQRSEQIRLWLRSLPPRATNKIWRVVSHSLPNSLLFNYLCAARNFYNAHGRLPIDPSDPRAAFNDYLFYRMIGNKWTALEVKATDKQHAKIIAKSLSNSVSVPRTEIVLDADQIRDPDDLRRQLNIYIDAPLIAKPTNSSGGVIFLNDSFTKDELINLFQSAKTNYFKEYRETQYYPLDRKIIVEEIIDKKYKSLSDYKFFCSRGQVLLCQIDLDRFTDHRRMLVTVPYFNMINIQYKYPLPDALPQEPEEFQMMIEAASELSRPFDFVRVDLYASQGSIYFGEFTFTPGASTELFSNEDFGVNILNNIKSSIRAASDQLALHLTAAF